MRSSRFRRNVISTGTNLINIFTSVIVNRAAGNYDEAIDSFDDHCYQTHIPNDICSLCQFPKNLLCVMEIDPGLLMFFDETDE